MSRTGDINYIPYLADAETRAGESRYEIITVREGPKHLNPKRPPVRRSLTRLDASD